MFSYTKEARQKTIELQLYPMIAACNEATQKDNLSYLCIKLTFFHQQYKTVEC
ncbi:MAG: hypothetical protein KatS3mg033_1360 [Thermonema sp.]|nr:MAG: hypothetical protein KatS3mg033_1360 [Thermonema sp.]